jgi:hypothetical protein
MSLYIDFEPHSFYRGFAIRKWDGDGFIYHFNAEGYKWEAYTDNGNTYQVDTLQADTLKELKQKITEYRSK